MNLITKVIIFALVIAILLVELLLLSYKVAGDIGVMVLIIIFMIMLLIGKIRRWES
jgi:hypothetical protein